MRMFEGKKGLILGVANDRSIALAIANFIMSEGGECGFTHLPDRPDDEKRRARAVFPAQHQVGLQAAEGELIAFRVRVEVGQVVSGGGGEVENRLGCSFSRTTSGSTRPTVS